MYWMPFSKPLLKIWSQNFRTNIGPIGARINEPAADIAKSAGKYGQPADYAD